ncbi:hypothetical protein VOLCADRAFT_98137 [Volvox carteri f. nagariensis]|uniref:Pherophorin domain-containing protein n=1 Tax=Volvox carteri f. nagariensis TaxID=3068 RepID=D8UEJ5_VOLCA|nr:uncharacterized protein VOLCADRAFT_98137 [Volvox carteri f. nagariensis]EFJ41894.1 hypothetical protein VOLCADRAFT_98137 [Volvox carteri f. nagariensis]|eukprot:XP_002957092.1 hypothetical protein VOLCADRAFT_98137 [Volvox carteri f. nagariensis]
MLGCEKTDFRFSVCDARNASLTPYRLSSPGNPVSVNGSFATYCFTITADALVQGSSSSCAKMQINKIDFIINTACVAEVPKAIRNAIVNGTVVSSFRFETKTFDGNPYGMLAVSGLKDFTAGLLAGNPLQLCLVMRRSSICGTPQTLCYAPVVTYCFMVSPTGDVDEGSKCAGMAINKVEFLIMPCGMVRHYGQQFLLVGQLRGKSFGLLTDWLAAWLARIDALRYFACYGTSLDFLRPHILRPQKSVVEAEEEVVIDAKKKKMYTVGRFMICCFFLDWSMGASVEED